MTLDLTTAAEVGRITSDLVGLVARLTGRLEGTSEALEMAEETITELSGDLATGSASFEEARDSLREVSEENRLLKRKNESLTATVAVRDKQLEGLQAARDEYTVGIPDFMRTVRGTVQYLGEDVPAARWGTRVYFARKSGGHLVTEMATLGSVVEQSFRIADLEPFELVARPRSSYGFGFKKL